jgi:uncharacterized protein YjiS (DUF1127 family)
MFAQPPSKEGRMSFQSRDSTTPQGLYLTAAEPRASFGRRLLFTFSLWRQRIVLRRRLAEMDSRSLRELGISPAAAAYESGKAFWKSLGCLR